MRQTQTTRGTVSVAPGAPTLACQRILSGYGNLSPRGRGAGGRAIPDLQRSAGSLKAFERTEMPRPGMPGSENRIEKSARGGTRVEDSISNLSSTELRSRSCRGWTRRRRR